MPNSSSGRTHPTGARSRGAQPNAVLRCGIAAAALALLAGCTEQTRTSSRGDDVPVEVVLVARDSNDVPVIVLEETDGSRQLPIWIGVSEARSIASEMEEREPPRPNTHDLARQMIASFDATVVRVVVTELRESTYYAVLDLRRDGRNISLDSRPSDAIAIALRAGAPIFVRASVFGAAALTAQPEDAGQQI